MTRAHQRNWILLGLMLATVLVYWNTMNGAFHFDDKQHLLENPRIRSMVHWRELIHHNFRPLLWLTFVLNYALVQYQVFGWHVVNLSMHLLNAFLVYLLVRRLFENSPFSAEAMGLGTAFLFALHPIQTESVSYISSRSELMVALFYLTSLLFWDSYRQSEKKMKEIYYVGSIFAFLLALGTKESAIMLPFLLVGWELFFPRKQRLGMPWKKYAKEFLPYFLFFATWFVVRKMSLGVLGNPEGEKITGYESYPFTQTRVICRYIGLLFFPYRQNIDPDIALSHSFWEVPVMASSLFHLGVFASAWRFRKRLPWLGFGVLWFYTLLAPTSSFVALRDVMAEHRVYLASLGIFWLMIMGIYWIFHESLGIETKKTLVLRNLFLVMFFLLCAILTVQRNRVYRNGITLWGDTIQKSPQKSRPHYNLGNAYFNAEMYEKAIEEYSQSIQLRPSYLSHYFNRANTYKILKKFDLAIQDYDKSIELKPLFYKAWYNKGIVYQQLGEYQKALDCFSKVAQIQPDFVENNNALGAIYLAMGRSQEARSHFQKALQRSPDSQDMNFNMGVSYFNENKFDPSMAYFQAVLQVNPRHFQSLYYLAKSRANLGLDPQKTKKLLDLMLKYYPNVESQQQFLDLRAQVYQQF